MDNCQAWKWFAFAREAQIQEKGRVVLDGRISIRAATPWNYWTLPARRGRTMMRRLDPVQLQRSFVPVTQFSTVDEISDSKFDPASWTMAKRSTSKENEGEFLQCCTLLQQRWLWS